MHLPYYFQYYTTECENASCGCPEENSAVSDTVDIKIKHFSLVSHEATNYTSNSTKYWTHCWSDFMSSTTWDIWYTAYQVSFSNIWKGLIMYDFK